MWEGASAIFGIREEYALRALVELARRSDGRPVQSRELAERQRIPPAYLDQILLQLRRGGVVRSVRGAAGGFLLVQASAAVRIGDVLRALRGDVAVFKGTTEDADEPGGAEATTEFWARVQEAVDGVLDHTTLADLAERQHQLDQERAPMFYI